MQSYLTVNNFSPSFGINVSSNFVKSAHNYYNGVEYRPWRAKIFDNKVNKFATKYGFNDYTINYDKIIKDGKIEHALYLTSDNDVSVLITKANALRKVIKEFIGLTPERIQKMIENIR